MSDPAQVVANPWQALRALTQARIALGRAGVSMPTAAQLEFQLAHARARDAVHQPLNVAALGGGWLLAHSACADRAAYLQRPDLGRRLDDASRGALAGAAPPACDLALVVADGLSALAIEQNAKPFLDALLPRLAHDGWVLGPPVAVLQGRVAIGDEIGALLNAKAVLVLIGERPGLSSPDSMGLYMTWGPRAGRTDAQRNCVSNVRPAGLSYAQAAHRVHYLLDQARARGLSGVGLKDETAAADVPLAQAGGNFLLG
jgi:ethanolamine ammonia-lyase small subunit